MMKTAVESRYIELNAAVDFSSINPKFDITVENFVTTIGMVGTNWLHTYHDHAHIYIYRLENSRRGSDAV